jgi:hypothetical protein
MPIIPLCGVSLVIGPFEDLTFTDTNVMLIAAKIERLRINGWGDLIIDPESFVTNIHSDSITEIINPNHEGNFFSRIITPTAASINYILNSSKPNLNLILPTRTLEETTIYRQSRIKFTPQQNAVDFEKNKIKRVIKGTIIQISNTFIVIGSFEYLDFTDVDNITVVLTAAKIQNFVMENGTLIIDPKSSVESIRFSGPIIEIIKPNNGYYFPKIKNPTGPITYMLDNVLSEPCKLFLPTSISEAFIYSPIDSMEFTCSQEGTAYFEQGSKVGKVINGKLIPLETYLQPDFQNC